MSDSLPELPQDLINKILICLPAKSVGRFRCVAKLWSSLLSSLGFMKSHRDFHVHNSPRSIIIPVPRKERFNKYPLLLIKIAGGASDITIDIPYEESTDEESTDEMYTDEVSANEESADEYPFLLTFPAKGEDVSSTKVYSPLFSGQEGWIRVGAGCHGFVLVLSEGRILVLNPVTLEALEVPKFPLPENFVGIRECQLGMGYDSLSDDYKIVLLSYYNGSYGREYDGTSVHIYSLKMNSWRSLANSPFNHHDLVLPQPVAFTNGRLHWLAKDSEGRRAIAAFNLAREEFERVPSPDVMVTLFGGDLAVLRGCLAIQRSYFFSKALALMGGYNDYYNFWIMKDYGAQESWNNLEIDHEDKNLDGYVCPVGEDEVVWKLWFGGWFAMYSLSTRLWKEFFVDGFPEHTESVGLLMAYTECLLSPNHISD